MIYKASLDKLAKWTTILVFMTLIIIGLKSIVELLNSPKTTEEIAIHCALLFLFFVILFSSWLFSPQSYNINENALIIHRKISDISIDFDSIEFIEHLTSQQIKGTIRTFGVGGLFGYFGKFHVPKIGSCTFYSSQRKNLILIKTNKKKYIITPDEIQLSDELIKKCKYLNSVN